MQINTAKTMTWRKCVVPVSKWDGNTGIPEMLANHDPDGWQPNPNIEYRPITASKPPRPIGKKAKPKPKPKAEPKPEKEPRTPKRNRYQDSETHKQCRRCLEIKPRTEFYKTLTAFDGLSPYCRRCEVERKRQRRNEKTEQTA